MSAFKLDRFEGIFPKVPDTLLAPRAAAIAENCDFAYGELRSLKGDFKLKDLAVAAQSVWSEDGLRFYAWAEDVDAVISPLQAGPANDRLYYTTNTDFRVTPRSLATIAGAAPTSSYRVGVPKPTVAPSITVVHPTLPAAAGATVDALPADTYAARLAAANAAAAALVVANTKTVTETRAYAYTYANIYNEEGPPSAPVVVEVKAQTHAGVTAYSTVTVQVTFDGSGSYVPINAARIYHTANGGATADYYYALSINGSSGAASAADTIKSSALNERLSSIDNYPPDPLLKGLIHIGNGILAAWKGNGMWFSDAYRPWSWPPKYMLTFKDAVISAIPHGTGALVTTVAKPVIVSGISPDAMSQTPLELPQAGSSKWAILSLDGDVAYASHDGIVIVTGGQATMRVSERFFTRDTWRARCNGALNTMQFAYYDGRLVVFSKTNAFKAFMVSMDEASGNMTDLPQLVAKTAMVLVTSDQMYTVNGTALSQFGGGSNLPVRWKSGDMTLPAPVGYAIAQAECSGDFTIQFYQKGVLGFTQALTTGDITFRLPSGPIPGHAGLPPSDRWQIEISGTGIFKKLKAAQSGRGLAEV